MHARRRFLHGTLALAATPVRALAADQPSLKIGNYSETIFSLPQWIAAEKGYFKQAGLEVAFETGLTQKRVVDAILEGTDPVGGCNPEVPFLEKAGADRVRLISGSANRLPHFLIAQPRFKRVADLKGATFGAISQTEGTTYVIQKMAAAAGLKRSDYKIAAVGSAPQRAKLMDDGVIDACLQPFPLSYEAEAKGFTNLGWAGAAEPDWQFGSMVANRAWLDANLEVATMFLVGLIRGRRFMTDHPDAAAEIGRPRLNTTPALARRAVSDTLRLQIMDRDLRWSEPGLKAVYATLQGAGAIPTSRAFRVADYVDPRPITRAIARINKG